MGVMHQLTWPFVLRIPRSLTVRRAVTTFRSVKIKVLSAAGRDGPAAWPGGRPVLVDSARGGRSAE
jgi:hypothetical protein